MRIATIYNPEHKSSRVYTEMKAKKAEELGILFEKYEILNSKSQINIKSQIQKLNEDQQIDGIMIQMPLLGFRNLDLEIVEEIAPAKDVDGLNPRSGVVPATVRAVIEILKYAFNNTPHPPLNLRGGVGGGDILVIGNKGLVGSRLQAELKCEGMDEEDFDPEITLKAEILISATGIPSLIKPEMVKNGVIAIDVGYPKGDFDPSTALRASFFTPVPGGVGPVTVAMLYANLVDLVRGSRL